MPVLPLVQQNMYCAQYRQRHPSWRSGEEWYTNLVQHALATRRDRGSLRILDLGCGAGGVLEHVNVETATLIGSDRDLRALKRHRLPSLRGVVADSAALPFPIRYSMSC